MKRYLRTRLIIPLLLSFVFCLGCVPKTRIIRAPSRDDGIVSPPSPASVLDARIVYLEGTLRKRELSDKDTKMAEELLSVYKMVRDTFRDNKTDPDCDRVIQKLYEILLHLDHNYFLKQEDTEPFYFENITVLSEVQDMIRNKFFSGDFQGVVTNTTKLKSSLSPEWIPLDIKLLFAMSLAKMGRLEEAAVAGESIPAELEKRPDLIFIVNHVKDTIRDKFFSGDYQGVIDDAIELKTVFGPDAVSVDIGFLLAVSLAEMGMKEEANILGGRLIREFEAKPDLAFLQNLLIEWQLDLGNREIVLQIYRELMNHMEEIMEEYQAGDVTGSILKDFVDQRIQRERESRFVYEEGALIWARELIEEERYEEAIQRINELGDDQDMALEMKELRDLAIDGFINQERDRAAAHLLRGRQTTDPEKKREYLLLSYDRLKSLAEKYPQSSLVETLNEDMERVEIELNKLKNTMKY